MYPVGFARSAHWGARVSACGEGQKLGEFHHLVQGTSRFGDGAGDGGVNRESIGKLIDCQAILNREGQRKDKLPGVLQANDRSGDSPGASTRKQFHEALVNAAHTGAGVAGNRERYAHAIDFAGIDLFLGHSHGRNLGVSENIGGHLV